MPDGILQSLRLAGNDTTGAYAPAAPLRVESIPCSCLSEVGKEAKQATAATAAATAAAAVKRRLNKVSKLPSVWTGDVHVLIAVYLPAQYK